MAPSFGGAVRRTRRYPAIDTLDVELLPRSTRSTCRNSAGRTIWPWRRRLSHGCKIPSYWRGVKHYSTDYTQGTTTSTGDWKTTLNEIVRRVLSVARPDRIILFVPLHGSNDQDSDIDLLVIEPALANTHERRVEIATLWATSDTGGRHRDANGTL